MRLRERETFSTSFKPKWSSKLNYSYKDLVVLYVDSSAFMGRLVVFTRGQKPSTGEPVQGISWNHPCSRQSPKIISKFCLNTRQTTPE